MSKELFKIKLIENKKGSVTSAISKSCSTETLLHYINTEYKLIKGFSNLESLINTDDSNVILTEDFQYKLLDTIDEILEDTKVKDIKEVSRLYRNNLLFGREIPRYTLSWGMLAGDSEIYPKGFFEILVNYSEEYEPLTYDMTIFLKSRLKTFIADLANDLFNTYGLNEIFNMIEEGKYKQIEMQQFFNTWVSEKKLDIFELALWCRNITEMYPVYSNILVSNPEEAKIFLDKFPETIRQDIIDNAVEITEKEFKDIIIGKKAANYDYLEVLLERGEF